MCDKDTIISNRKNFKFIIRQEYYEEDFLNFYDFLCDEYNIKDKNIDYFINNKRNNTSQLKLDKKLSNEAIINLKNFFIDDYKILNILVECKLISQDYLDSFL